ncbi:MAG: hypothetical protein HY270_10555 [Deltaproteobacteria bacterium]|nr:hypothetical protein [Deltaproteobacteria bacterium]
MAAVTLSGLAILLYGLPGASAFDPGTVALSLAFCLLLTVVAAWAHELYGPQSAVAAAWILVTLLLAARESGLVVTDLAAVSALVVFLFTALRCLLDPSIEAAVFSAAAFAWGSWSVPVGHLLLLLAAALLGRWLGATGHERVGRVVHGTLVAAAIIAAGGLALAAGLEKLLPSLSHVFQPPGEAPILDATALPSVVLLIVVRPWRRHRWSSDIALLGGLVVMLAGVLPCSEGAGWWTCVGSSSQARALLLAALPIGAVLGAANWTHERPYWWHWVAFGLLAVAVFQSLVG